MDTFHTETESRIPTRLQMVSANARARNLCWSNALGKRSELVESVDTVLRGLRGLKEQGADKAALHDMAASLHDQASDIEHGIHKELDEQNLVPCEPIDLSELDAFLKEVA